MQLRLAPPVCAISILFAAISFSSHAVSIFAAPRVVAWTGTQATDEAVGVTFANLGTPTLNQFGETAFLASVTGPGVVADENIGIWSGGAGGVVRIARGGLPVANDTNVEYGGFNPPIVDARGGVAFLGEIKHLAGTPPAEFVVITGSPGAIAPLYRRGDPAPGLGGPTFDASLLRLVHNAAGQSAFNATLAGAGVTIANDAVIYAEDSAGTLRLVAREGTPAPDTPAGVTFAVLSNFDFAMNSAGQVAFHGSLDGPGVVAANDRGIWSEGGGTVHLVAREGMQAPGAPAGSEFLSFIATGLQANDLGHVAFVATNRRIGPGVSDDQGIWSDRSGTLAPIAIDNQPAPGIGGGVLLTSFRDVTLNSSDHAAYVGALAGPGVNSDNSFGVWSEGLGGPRLVAREGNTAPGVTDGAVFRFFEALAMNRWGQTAFYGTVDGAGVTSANDNGLWAEAIDGTLRLLVREGDTVEVAPGEMRTVQAVGLIGGSAGHDGRRAGFNDRGQIVSLARFTDNSAAVLLWEDAVAQAGDLNASGVVDAADYTLWRDRLGSSFDATDYDKWRSHFGEAIEPGSGSATTSVPEPTGCWTLALGFAVVFAAVRRRCD